MDALRISVVMFPNESKYPKGLSMLQNGRSLAKNEDTLEIPIFMLKNVRFSAALAA